MAYSNPPGCPIPKGDRLPCLKRPIGIGNDLLGIVELLQRRNTGTSMLSVEHRAVYGSKEVDEIICSCGWRGPAFGVAEHYEKAARDAGESLAKFVTLMENECAGDEWEILDRLEDKAGYLSPVQFLVAVRNLRFRSEESRL